MSKELSFVNETELQQAKNDVGAVGFSSIQKEAEAMRVAMVVAQNFPRSMARVQDRIAQNCTRQRFAENAEYSYPRGGKDVTGATIKLVEAIAQCYGNIQYDIKELKRYEGYSECEAYAWDMENNVKASRSFVVNHTRDTKYEKKRLTDERDIREMIFNYGSRNLRACLERVMPRDLIEEALELCHKTLSSDTKPLGDRIKACRDKFADFDGVNTEFLEKLIGEKVEKWTNSHLSKLVKYYNALKQGEVTIAGLKENFIETISTEQLKELAGIIGSDQKKIAILEKAGYKMPEIKNIPKSDFEYIKGLFAEKKASDNIDKETGEVIDTPSFLK
ncbi:MAG: hypothetical protein EOM59_11745 [Clostridia bacterium]|nr:hypothetical protein [Clostridia bacterium]